ncbi:MAG: phosphomethylpyrimidine synthase ThiC, partial [Halofilum sp. (in: g-proteobacteria)]
MSTTANEVAAAAERLSAEVTQPFPASRKIYIAGSRPDLQVPLREIALAPTQTADGPQHNPPLPVYDTSGVYTDATARIIAS